MLITQSKKKKVPARHSKEQEIGPIIKEKKTTVNKIDMEIAQMLESADEECATNMVTSFKNMKQNMGIMSEHMWYLSTEIGTKKRA